jgi:dipeptidyl aminopeptidase/acylaminoacyl peptidase
VSVSISPSMLSRSHAVTDPRWSSTGARLAWVDTFDGRSDVVVAPADGVGPAVTVTGECGAGGGYCWASDDELVVASADGRLVLLDAAGGIVRVLTRDGRAFGPTVSVRGEIAVGIERDDACDIATLPLDGTQWPEKVSSPGASYAWDPAWSPDGADLAWHEWTLPEMPWDASRIVVRDGGGGKARVVDEAPGCGQPRFAPTPDRAQLAYVREHRLCVDGVPLLDEPCEHAEPAWSPGQRSFAWSPDGAELAWCRNEHGFGRLVVGAEGRKSARELAKGWHRGIDWSPAGIVAVRSGAVTPPQVVVLAANGSARQTVAQGAVGGFERTPLVEPKAVSWKSAGVQVHGLLWRPFERSARGARRLLVVVHGGPTGQALADWSGRVQYFVQRGWTVLQPNYRGSTGYGIEYLRALEGRWGELDTEDVATGIRHACKEGWADAGLVALMGGSAGGLTVLNVAARHPELVAAVIALYPVTDVLALNATTHRFESGYNTRLVGPLPEARPRYVANSAITHAAEIRAPVLLLHGLDDRSVPPAQSAALADAIRRTGTPVERHTYDGEGHGWRRAATVADEIERIDAFLAARLG